MRLVLFGATGFAGGKILREARQRGHEVVGVARHVESLAEPKEAGSLHDEKFVLDATAGADALIVAIPGRPMPDGTKLFDAVPTLFAAAARRGLRIGVVGGAGSLRVVDGGPRLIDTPEFPEEFKPEAGAHAEVLAALQEAPAGVDWFYVSPAANFGAHAPGERTGSYRLGGDVLVTDADGDSSISGDDYAIAFVDELERPTHRRQRFTVGY
ncbi:NAD(P)-dependent oxidoreductase [Saccharopolyspora sp. ASAGF58]|uniref:NAD(P)-dependent oxidoreductase n=1 Tax=Saccharopolyspora sp. ASAGF58 TaxID=2719023 RepID=UPI001440186F|nr:NAD(P)H-binding protein [Saccharopolyspora sp. ASAGF58]QIZ35871.1 NAD-dependent epimerase [Saccharopolyspora sp. ASAGF58]